MANYGVPENALTWDSFGQEVIVIVHEWLCDKKLTLSEYVISCLEYRQPFIPIFGNSPHTPSTNAPYGAQTAECYDMPSYNEILIQGFSHSFIDANWVDIWKCQQMEFWLSQLGTNLPYFASLRIPDGDYSDKKTKILNVVSLVISVLWNNGVDFDDLGGQKPRGEQSEIVPAIRETVTKHLYKVILTRIRSKRGTIKRDSGQKSKVRVCGE